MINKKNEDSLFWVKICLFFLVFECCILYLLFLCLYLCLGLCNSSSVIEFVFIVSICPVSVCVFLSFSLHLFFLLYTVDLKISSWWKSKWAASHFFTLFHIIGCSGYKFWFQSRTIFLAHHIFCLDLFVRVSLWQSLYFFFLCFYLFLEFYICFICICILGRSLCLLRQVLVTNNASSFHCGATLWG